MIKNLYFMGKLWNIKESLKLGAAYKPFDMGYEKDKGVLKSIILYQKDVLGKDVFTNIFNDEYLPNLNWNFNAIYQQIDQKDLLDKKYFLRVRGKGGDDGFIDNILKLD